MYALSVAAVVVAGVLAGGVIGTIFGFSLASHKYVLAGYRPMNANRFIRWIARPTSEFNRGEGIIFMVLMLMWIVVFFALCVAPFVVAGKLQGDDSLLQLVAMVALVA